MSLNDRRLVLPSTAVHSPGTSATVVGRLPRQIDVELRKQLLGNDDADANGLKNVSKTSGRIDVSSGLSIACISHTTTKGGNDNDDSNSKSYFTSISIWEHRTCTLTEELERPEEVSTFIIEHDPEAYDEQDNTSTTSSVVISWMVTEALVALSPFGGGGSSIPFGESASRNAPYTALRHHTSASTRQLRSATHRLPSYSLYACSPYGTVYLWNNALEGRTKKSLSSPSKKGGGGVVAWAQRDPDAYVNLPIGSQFVGESYAGEYVTRVVALEPMSEAGGAGSSTSGASASDDILVSTNRGRLFLVVCQGYPTQLQARELLPEHPETVRALYFPTAHQAAAAAAAGSGYFTRMFDGIKETILPSSDPFSAVRSRTIQVSNSGIVDILCMPIGRSSHSSNGIGTPKGGDRPSSAAVTSYATPLRPSQRARLHRHVPYHRSFLVLRDNLEISRWTMFSSLEGSIAGGGGVSSNKTNSPGMEALLKDGFGRGTTSLDDIKDLKPMLMEKLSKQWERLTKTTNDQISFKVMRGSLARQRQSSSSCRSINNSLVFVVRVSLKGEEEGSNNEGSYIHRLYMVQCTSGSSERLYSTTTNNDDDDTPNQTIELINVQWLNKYPSNAIPNLVCKGILASELDSPAEEDDDDEDGGSNSNMNNVSLTKQCMAFSFWESSSRGSSTALSASSSAVSAALVQFGESSTRNNDLSVPTTTFDIDLPQDLVPNVLGSGFTSMSEGTLFMTGTTGLVICLKATPEIYSSRSSLSTMQSLSTSLPKSHAVVTVVSPSSASELRTLTRHLVDAFKQFDAQGTNATDAMVVASLPPSLKEARTVDLNLAVVEASRLLCNEPAARSFSKAGGSLGVIKEKMTQHRHMVTFLSRGGLYRRCTQGTRQQLMDHGELLQGCIALVEWCQPSSSMVKDDNTSGTSTSSAIKTRIRTTLLNGIENDCTHLLQYLTCLQNDVVEYAEQHEADLGISDEMRRRTNHVTDAIVESLKASALYRSRQREVMYEIPAQATTTNHVSWTCSNELRTLLQEQCNLVKALGFEKGEGPNANAKDRTKNATCVEVMTNTWLQSYSNIGEDVEQSSSRQVLAKEYEAAKETSVWLVEKYVSPQAALDFSIEHYYFLGIVRLCDEEEQYHGNNSSKISQTLINLMAMNHPSFDKQHKDLHGNTFPQFVLKYYADLGLYSNLMDLGTYCPSELNVLLDQDHRLYNYRWINRIRCGQFADSVKELDQMLTEQDAAQVDSTREPPMLGKDVLLGLQKLAAKLAAK